MRSTRLAVSGFALLLAVSLLGVPGPAAAQDQSNKGTDYTMPQYNAYQAAHKEPDPQKRIQMLDDLVGTLGSSKDLLPYIEQAYLDSYTQLKNYPKLIEYADRVIGLGDQLPVQTRLEATVARCQAFEQSFNPKASDARDQLSKEVNAAKSGLVLLDKVPKPANTSDDQFAEGKKPAIGFFNSAAGSAELQLKDYTAAADSYKAVLAVNPKDAASYYHMGVADLGMAPPHTMDGYWAIARAIDLKIPGDAQVKDYLRKQMLAYEQPGCDSQIDAQLSELLTVAQGSADRPTTYSIPSADDLAKLRAQSNILTVISDLQAGGDKAKNTWLMICGSEFPVVVGKIIEATPGDGSVDFKVYEGPTDEDVQAATVPNMDVNVKGQPDAARLGKDDGIRFSGTLVSYDPQPFLLHWDEVKVDPTIIPEEKVTPGRKPHKVPPKKPSR
ncbi:MAG: hypothetical protein ACRD50_02005 [Candidatus Acidiferrales bacterium]